MAFAQLAECAHRMEGYTVAVEVRNDSWFKEGARWSTLAWLREQNLALVAVDEPQGFFSSVPAVWEATSPDLAVVREARESGLRQPLSRSRLYGVRG